MPKKFYPTRDRISMEEAKALGLDRPPIALASLGVSSSEIHAVMTGEFRKPKKGEWYLSGAVPEAYKAPNDFVESYHICRLVRTRTRTITEIVCEMPALQE